MKVNSPQPKTSLCELIICSTSEVEDLGIPNIKMGFFCPEIFTLIFFFKGS